MFEEMAATVLGRPPALGPVRLVAVDGPSGAGKTTVAGCLADALTAAGAGVAVVHTDDLLDGWADQVTFWPRLERDVLAPLRRAEPGRYRPYDWVKNQFKDQFIVVPVTDVLIVEGVTSAREEVRAELTLSVFVTAPPHVCLARVIARDGPAVREPLRAWRREEAAFHRRDATERAADAVVDADGADGGTGGCAGGGLSGNERGP